MLKLLILQGLPASGKSTYARELAENNPKEWVIVNRDDIRDMLGKYWVPKREKLVTSIEHDMIKRGLEHGYNVVIDATNLNPKSLSSFEILVDLINYNFDCSNSDERIIIEYKMFHIDVEEAILRDKDRKRTVGAQVIRGFHNRYKEKLEN